VLLIREDEGPIARLTMNAPERLNPLSDAMIAELQNAFDELAKDKQIRVVVLAANGRAFCAGHDLKELIVRPGSDALDTTHLKDLFDRCAQMMQSVLRLPQPVIAEVQGLATAAGCQLVATCDLAVASDEARFGVNGVNVGLFCSTPMVALSRNIPRKQALELLATGEFLSATRAAELGLINRAVAAADLRSETVALAQTIASKLGSAVKTGKRAFYEQLEMPIDQAYDYTADVILKNLANRDTQEGIQAFIEKRDPEWTQ